MEKLIKIIILGPFMVIVLIFQGITYLVAHVNIPLSKIPFAFQFIAAKTMDVLSGWMGPYRLGTAASIYNEYEKMIQEIKKEKYDELYYEMRKREEKE